MRKLKYLIYKKFILFFPKQSLNIYTTHRRIYPLISFRGIQHEKSAIFLQFYFKDRENGKQDALV